jgi:hypothetical protein
VLIAAVLKENTSLKKLWLSQNRLGDESGKGFAEALKKNTTLEELLAPKWAH